MKRWLGIAAVVLLLIWAPFLYRELRATPPEVDDSADPLFEQEAVAEVDAAAVGAPQPADEVADDVAEEPAEGEEPVAEEEPAEGEQPVAEEEPAEGEQPAAEGEQPAEGEPPGVAAVVGAIAAGLAKTYESEARDALWAGDAEAKLRAMIDDAELVEEEVLELLEVGCQRTLCRAVVNRGVEPVAEGAFHGLLEDHRGRMFQHASAKEGEERHFVVYLLREGYAVDDIQ